MPKINIQYRSLRMDSKRLKYWANNIIQWLLILLITTSLAICLRVFLFAVYSIPTPSMEPAIVAGDKVVMTKLIPGPRIIQNFFSLYQGEKPDIKRLRGIRAIRQNDILIFNFPYSDWKRLQMDVNVFYAKRCVAIPGDTFLIENGIYKVKNSNAILGNRDKQEQLAAKDSGELKPAVYPCFPYDERFGWTMKNFGPFYLPKKQETLSIDSMNVLLYKRLIIYETDREITVHNGKVYLNDSLITSYTFQQNYYFMAGDYVFDSQDSRYWGLLPEDHIVGKVAFVWNTKDRHTGKKRWHRFLKAVK